MYEILLHRRNRPIKRVGRGQRQLVPGLLSIANQ
nr:MAG TPA: hypothetical protein [Caudoviricetes sp.]